MLFVLIILFGWFYWFQWRPANIRSTCAKQAGDSAAGVYKALSEYNLDYKVEMADKFQKSGYATCLNKRGIKN